MDEQGRLTPCPAHRSGVAERCHFFDPAMGRCHDRSGLPHGHHFKPESIDTDLVLHRDEARELVAYLRHQYLDVNTWPLLAAAWVRLDDALGPQRV